LIDRWRSGTPFCYTLGKLYERDLGRFLEDAYLRVGGTAVTALAASQELLSAAGGKRTPKISTGGSGKNCFLPPAANARRRLARAVAVSIAVCRRRQANAEGLHGRRR
jgi:hypothetical protein